MNTMYLYMYTSTNLFIMSLKVWLTGLTRPLSLEDDPVFELEEDPYPDQESEPQLEEPPYPDPESQLEKPLYPELLFCEPDNPKLEDD